MEYTSASANQEKHKTPFAEKLATQQRDIRAMHKQTTSDASDSL